MFSITGRYDLYAKKLAEYVQTGYRPQVRRWTGLQIPQRKRGDGVVTTAWNAGVTSHQQATACVLIGLATYSRGANIGCRN